MEFVWVVMPNFYFSNHWQHVQSQFNPLPTQIVPQVSEEAPKPLNSTILPCPVESSEKLVITREDLEAAGNDSRMKTWSQEEDRLLMYFREKEKMEWEDVAKNIPNRTARMCYNRHKRITLSDKVLWRRKDDEKLLRLIEEHGQDWKALSTLLSKWTPAQVKDHYMNHLRPGLSQEEWTIEEDLVLIECINKHGRNWEEAQKVLPARSLGHIQYRVKGRLAKLNQKKLKEMVSRPCEF